MADESDNSREKRDNLTHYGQGIGWTLGGLFFLLCAWYLEPLPNTELFGVALYPEIALNTLLYILTGTCWFFTVTFFGLAPRESPGMGRFLKSLFGGGEEGWRYVFLTTFAVGLAALCYGVNWIIPGEPAALDWIKWLFTDLCGGI
ncbi:MAG: hypothetical protein LC781_17825 [Actinobacteria bacterium]|nr:hypothetical protein [Actinomycetota bacterium]